MYVFSMFAVDTCTKCIEYVFLAQRSVGDNYRGYLHLEIR